MVYLLVRRKYLCSGNIKPFTRPIYAPAAERQDGCLPRCACEALPQRAAALLFPRTACSVPVSQPHGSILASTNRQSKASRPSVFSSLAAAAAADLCPLAAAKSAGRPAFDVVSVASMSASTPADVGKLQEQQGTNMVSRPGPHCGGSEDFFMYQFKVRGIFPNLDLLSSACMTA